MFRPSTFVPPLRPPCRPAGPLYTASPAAITMVLCYITSTPVPAWPAELMESCLAIGAEQPFVPSFVPFSSQLDRQRTMMHKSHMTARCGCVSFGAWDTTSLPRSGRPTVCFGAACYQFPIQPAHPLSFPTILRHRRRHTRDAGPMHGEREGGGGEDTDSPLLVGFLSFTFLCTR